MKTIVLEMERLRNMNAGLGQYCYQLGHALAGRPEAAAHHFECYLPAHLSGIFGAGFSYRPVRKWHKLTGIATEAALWHNLHQDAEYFPTEPNIPVVMTIHDLNFLERTDYPNWRKKMKINRLQAKIQRSKGVVYISEFVKNTVHEHLNVPASLKEAVIYNGAPALQDARVQQSETTQPFLFSIGLHPKKNYVAALPILLQQPQYQWVIAGSDDKGYQRTLEKTAQELGLKDRLVFTGAVSETEKWSLYQRCSALIFPSLSEGFGLPIVEAMAAGKPVFLSNRTSMPEIGGKEAYYFDSFEPAQMQQVFEQGMTDWKKDADKPRRLKAWAASFSWTNAANDYLNFYTQILNA